jgi:DNA-binding response OmpR family regulator
MDISYAKKIVVADDEEDIRVYVSKILQRANYEVRTASCGSEALEVIKKFKPDLAVLDIMLPDMQGDDIAIKLAEDPATAGLPIIFLTGIIRKNEEVKGLTSGRHRVLAKPITREELVNVVKETLKKPL